MVKTAKASFEIGVSARGRPTVRVTRPGEVSSTQYEFRSRADAEAWLSARQASGTFDRSSEHPLEGPRETD
jgi:hypothetical protein